jgi:hypothetical protein
MASVEKVDARGAGVEMVENEKPENAAVPTFSSDELEMEKRSVELPKPFISYSQ